MKIKVLIADDEKTFKDMFAKVLVDEGMDVIACDDGLEAIEAISRESFDVAILDLKRNRQKIGRVAHRLNNRSSGW